jgi:hypothetical protein
MSCELASGNVRIAGLTKDLNEEGACIETKEPLLLTSGLVTLHLHGPSGTNVALQGLMTRQEKNGSCFEIGVGFVEVDEGARQAITGHIFNPATVWTDGKERQPGIWDSLWSLMTAVRSAWQSRRPARRHFPRAKRELECEVEFHGRSYSGRNKDISFLGLSVAVENDFSHVSGPALIFMEGITLKVSMVGVARQGRRTVAQFRVEGVDKGEERWHALNMSGW